MVCLACHPPERKAQQPLFVFLPVYPELVARIGATVPNYQGVFLRGYGSQTSYHYGVVGHWSAGLVSCKEIRLEILQGLILQKF